MKQRHLWPNTISLTLGLLAGLSLLALGPGARAASNPPMLLAAKKNTEPVFSDLPAVRPARPSLATNAAAPTLAQATPPEVPAPAQPAAPPPANPSVTDHTQGKTLYSFQASDLELKAALATFARANNLNIVPDHDVTGTVTLDVRDLPLSQMMRAFLEANDCTWQEEGGLIRVRNTETRTFTVDYLRLSRNGRGQSSATLNSATSGGSSGGMGGGGGGGGGGMGGGGGGGMGGAGSMSGSSVNLTADNQIDFWKELKEEMGFILTTAGKNSMSINMTAGLVQVTDRPSALKRVENYLRTVDKTVHRQVDLEAKLYDVMLNDQFQFGIDWVHIASAYGGALGFGAATFPAGAGGVALQDSTVSGLNHAIGGANPFALVFSNFNTAAAINALQQQGSVEVISKPRIRTLNNQTALIKVGTETPFFAQTFQSLQSQSGNQTFSGDQITTVTVGTILSITPQISDDRYISLDISPVLTSLIATEESPSGTATAPVLDTKQASTLVRVQDGTTVVLGGLIQDSRAKNDRKVPLLGDIPLLGKLFTGTFRFKQKKELVIFITPHIVQEGEVSVVDNRGTPIEIR